MPPIEDLSGIDLSGIEPAVSARSRGARRSLSREKPTTNKGANPCRTLSRTSKERRHWAAKTLGSESSLGAKLIYIEVGRLPPAAPAAPPPASHIHTHTHHTHTHTHNAHTHVVHR